MTDNRTLAAALCLCLSLPMAAQARPAGHGAGTGDDVHQELVDARKEVRADLAKAREDLLTKNLTLGQDFHFGHHDAKHRELPVAEITPQGDFLVDGKAETIDAGQRTQLLAYRKQVVDIALDGIEAGQVAADAALDAVGGSWVGILFNAMTGRLERRVESTVRQHIEPMVLGICRQLPAVMESQQQLAASLPSFRPYADLDQHDVADCENEMRNEFASN
jgi:hypothetical protein